MAYYDALISAWNSATQPPPGVTGSPLTGAMTTQQKCDTVNAWKTTGPALAQLIGAWQIYDAIVVAEYDALSASAQAIVNNILSMGNVNCASGSNARRRLLIEFPAGTTSNTALLTLFNNNYLPSQDWCLVNGYPTHGVSGPGNISTSDALNAGLV